MKDKAAKILRKALEKAGKDKLVKALDNVLAKNKMEDDAPAKPQASKQDLVNFALEKQAKAIEDGKYYDKHAVARIEAGDTEFIENYTQALRDSKESK